MADKKLGKFEGRNITSVGVVIRKTGDGLSTAVEVEPDLALDIKIGDEGFIVLEYACVDVHFPAEHRNDPAAGGVRRLPILDAKTATFIEGDVVADAIRQQRELNERHLAEKKGQHELSDVELLEEHDRGEHVGDAFPTPHCSACAAEEAAIAEEAAAG